LTKYTLRDVWPSTRVQRCLFHVCMNITGPTGLRPRLEAGRRLRKVAVALSRVSDAATAAEWMASYNRWERDFAGFLDQKSRWEDGTVADRHMRLAKARRMVRRRIREGQLFTFLDPPDGCAEPIPPTNNLIESWNARIRDMLRHHRGLSLARRIKAICWWCHQHTEVPETDAWFVANAVTDERIEELYRKAWEKKPAGRMGGIRRPDALRNRDRLGRLPPPLRIPRHPRVGYDRTHILAYNPNNLRIHYLIGYYPYNL
jgi:hypothetical protein